MKTWKSILISFSACVVAFGGGCLTMWQCGGTAYIQVGIPIPGKTVYLKPGPEAHACGDSIDIQGSMVAGNMFAVIARDECKQSDKKFPMSCRPAYPRHMIGLTYAGSYHDAAYHSQYGASYYYMWRYIGIGGGPVVTRNESTGKMGGGLQAGIFARF